MQKLEEQIVETAIHETQESTGTVTSTEFQNQVEQRVEVTTTTLQNQFGDAADELVGNVTVTMTTWQGSMNDLVGPNSVGDTEEDHGASGLVERSSKKMVLSKENTELKVDDRGYRERVKGHEDVHQNLQATDYSSQTVTYMDNAGEAQEATVVGDLTEWQAITVPGQPDSDLVPAYVEHRRIGNEVAMIAGEGAVTSTLASGDVESLQATIIEKQREQIMAHMFEGQGMPNEQN
jgi:hypothetical protein